MKKCLLFILSALAFTGMSVAQNIYSSGYFTNSSGKRSAAVYRNGTKLYDSGNTTDNPNDNTAVNVYNDNVYWVKRMRNSGKSIAKRLKPSSPTRQSSPIGAMLLAVPLPCASHLIPHTSHLSTVN